MSSVSIVEWSPILEVEDIPPMGGTLRKHLEQYKGVVRHASCSAWGLLYKVLKDNDLPVGMVEFTSTGKPFFSDTTIHFSISHSKGICAVAVSTHSIGIDVERCKTDYNSHLVERSLCGNEKRGFDGDFTRIWCRKEAVAKLTGEGIIAYPDYIDTTSYEFKENLIDYNNHTYWIVSIES